MVDAMNVPPHLVAFLQPDRAPFDREGGLHGVLFGCFPVDGRQGGLGASLDYWGYGLVPIDGYLALRVTFRLVWWASGAIQGAVEQPLDLLMFCPDHGRPYPSRLVAFDSSASDVVEHVTSIVRECQAHAQVKVRGAPRGVTPADLVFDCG
jgi:hypothetical protein